MQQEDLQKLALSEIIYNHRLLTTKDEDKNWTTERLITNKDRYDDGYIEGASYDDKTEKLRTTYLN